ncbi:class I SAM-dependent methyltransferase [Pseudaquabacterium rugosum]|uniref:Class I SAM-dependent methyltransferase n=1 Tax=Pseudaquabacterium rugosum TaxID=2984194 RepID=A0ABU9B9G0_9BURK
MTTNKPTKHLDLGCGSVPRNPFKREKVYGIDINTTRNIDPPNIEITCANLFLDPIPFPNAEFHSVSAYDFIEHVPRVLARDSETIFPFVRLMSEIHRVLKPGGFLYALSPCYPSETSFIDPTHVNHITERSHLYFTGEKPLAAMYGFVGRFDVVTSDRVVYSDAVDPMVPKSLGSRFRHFRHKIKGKLHYCRWHLMKPTG